MEASIMGYYRIIGYIWGLYRDNGKENGSYYLRTEILKVDAPPSNSVKSSDIPIIPLL